MFLISCFYYYCFFISSFLYQFIHRQLVSSTSSYSTNTAKFKYLVYENSALTQKAPPKSFPSLEKKQKGKGPSLPFSSHGKGFGEVSNTSRY